jgi:hypothetical protein
MLGQLAATVFIEPGEKRRPVRPHHDQVMRWNVESVNRWRLGGRSRGLRPAPEHVAEGLRLGKVRVVLEGSVEQSLRARQVLLFEADLRQAQQRSGVVRIEREHALEIGPRAVGLASRHVQIR